MRDDTIQPVGRCLRCFGILAVLSLAVFGRASQYGSFHPEWGNTLYVLVVPTLFFILKMRGGHGPGESSTKGLYRWLPSLNRVLTIFVILLILLFFVDSWLFGKLTAPPAYIEVRRLCIQLLSLGCMAAGVLLWSKPLCPPQSSVGYLNEMLLIYWYGGLEVFSDNLVIYYHNRIAPIFYQDLFTWILLPVYVSLALYIGGRHFLRKAG